MSVYAKDRKTTKIQYVVTAQKLQVAVIQYLMNDNHVPKKWRYMLAQDAILKVSDTAYNSGCRTAIKLLQKSLYIAVDGKIGKTPIELEVFAANIWLKP